MMAWPASTGWRSNLHRGRNCKKSADRCRRDLNPDTGPLLQGGRALPAYAYSSSQRKISVTQDSYDPHRSKHRRRPVYEALAAAFGADYTLYCLPWAVQEQLTALREHLDKVSGPLEQRRARPGWAVRIRCLFAPPWPVSSTAAASPWPACPAAPAFRKRFPLPTAP